MERQLWLERLARFIVEAHKKGWAAEGKEVDPIFPGMKSLFYESKSGIWQYRDNYSGYFRAPGFTVVSYREQPAWGMTYFGPGQTAGQEKLAKETFAFLKKALMQVTPEMPFRGPSEFPPEGAEGDWKYKFRMKRGDITDFLAEEEVSLNDYVMFAQTIGGGLIIGKDDKRRLVYPWRL